MESQRHEYLDLLLAEFGDELRQSSSGSASSDNVFTLAPRAPAEVATVVRRCLALGIAMVPQGGGTGLAGGAELTKGDRRATVAISLARLNRIRDVDPLNRTVVVDGGTTLESVDAAVADAGLTFPLKIGSGGSAQIGGAIATCAGGIRSWRYGTMRSLTLGIEAVLANGDVWSDLRSVGKVTAGLNLSQLLIGSEGTLGIVTGAVLRLAPRPNARATAFLAVDDLDAAIRLFRLFESAGGLDVFELLSARGLGFYAAANAERRLPASLGHPWHILAEWTGDDVAALSGHVESLLALEMDTTISDGVLAQSERQRADFWHVREAHGAACRQAGTPVQHDIAVPVSAIPLFMAEAQAMVRKRLDEAAIVPVCHVGDGNIHFDILRPFNADQTWDRRMKDATRDIHDLAMRLHGTFSAEHGIGAMKRDELRRLTPDGSYAAMKAVKTALDPKGLMNPGKVLL